MNILSKMKKIAICLLAYGEEHIIECNELIEKLSKYVDKLDFIVASDSPNEISKIATKVIEIKEKFNYNQKIIPIEYGLNKYDVILFMDTDMSFRPSIDFSFLNNLEDGFYAQWFGKIQKHIDEIPTSIYSILNGTSKFEDLNEYGSLLKTITKSENDTFFIDEYLFVIKSTDINKKQNFITEWKKLYETTKLVSPKDRYGNRRGSLEGILISMAIYNSNFKLLENESIRMLFSYITHHLSFDEHIENYKINDKKSLV